MTARDLDRRSRVLFVAAWGSSLQQPGWAVALGVKLNRALVCSFDEAQEVAAAGAKSSGYPAYVQKWLTAPAVDDLPAVRSLLGSWRLSAPDGAWAET